MWPMVCCHSLWPTLAVPKTDSRQLLRQEPRLEFALKLSVNESLV